MSQQAKSKSLAEIMFDVLESFQPEDERLKWADIDADLKAEGQAAANAVADAVREALLNEFELAVDAAQMRNTAEYGMQTDLDAWIAARRNAR